VVSQPRFHHKNASGLNKNPVVVFHHILRNKRERINVEDVMGLVGRRIVLMFFKPLPPTPTIVNFVFIASFMVMMQTIVSHHLFCGVEFSRPLALDDDISKIPWGSCFKGGW